MNVNRMNQVPRGQTLIESLVAIGIILVGMIALISLFIVINRTASANLNQAVATQLAHEAIDAVRYVRDSNWLKHDSGLTITFDDSLITSTDYGGVPIWDPTSSVADVALQIATVSGGSITSNEAIIYQDASGHYLQTSSATIPNGYSATKYRRWLTLYPICRDTSTTTSTTEQIVTADGSDCSIFGANYSMIGIEVTATVQWVESSGTRQYILVDDLYDWKS